MKSERGPSPEKFEEVYRTEEIDIPEALQNEGYSGRAYAGVVKEGNQFRAYLRLDTKGRLDLEPTRSLLRDEQGDAEADAEKLVADVVRGVVE